MENFSSLFGKEALSYIKDDMREAARLVSKFPRKGSTDCYPPETRDLAKKRYPNLDDLYSYIHWKADDSLAYPNNPLSRLFQIYHLDAIDYLKRYGRPGEIVLRMIKYSGNTPFLPHTDPSLFTLNIGSVSEDLKEIKVKHKFHYGEQARLLEIGAKPLIHKFQGSKDKYSFILFGNMHFTQKTKKGGTIGEYLTKVCTHA